VSETVEHRGCSGHGDRPRCDAEELAEERSKATGLPGRAHHRATKIRSGRVTWRWGLTYKELPKRCQRQRRKGEASSTWQLTETVQIFNWH